MVFDATFREQANARFRCRFAEASTAKAHLRFANSTCKSLTSQFGPTSQCAPVAQLDRVSDFESEGRKFESCRVYHSLFQSKISCSQIVATRPICRIRATVYHTCQDARNNYFRPYGFASFSARRQIQALYEISGTQNTLLPDVIFFRPRPGSSVSLAPRYVKCGRSDEIV